MRHYRALYFYVVTRLCGKELYIFRYQPSEIKGVASRESKSSFSVSTL